MYVSPVVIQYFKIFKLLKTSGSNSSIRGVGWEFLYSQQAMLQHQLGIL